ncbi:hypothetical protein HPT30_12630 [Paenibacillus sp. JW14]|uniref:Uncharacterized protein n=1 Tax=Paenibacillus agri TaxID=2744309 RepID=A0A850EJE3_9BACL|nr:hypothetical protein [Paenibacillus agri]
MTRCRKVYPPKPVLPLYLRRRLGPFPKGTELSRGIFLLHRECTVLRYLLREYDAEAVYPETAANVCGFFAFII